MEELHPGDIILLNGTSSSGKSTLTRALQEIMEQTYSRLDEVDTSLASPSEYANIIKAAIEDRHPRNAFGQ